MLRLPQQILQHFSPDDYAHLLATHTPIGTHAETGDLVLLPNSIRYSGLHALGATGVGKSYVLETMAVHDGEQGQAVVYIDPHGDSIPRIVSRLSEDALSRTYVLDMNDRRYAFGLNPFANVHEDTREATLNQLLHIFEVNWPEIMSQQHAPNFLRACILTLLDTPGSTMLDMLPLLTSKQARNKMVAHGQDETVQQFWAHYETLSDSAKTQQAMPIINRLNALFMGHPTIRSIVGQQETTLDMRRANENREIILVPLPLKTNKDEAQWVGTIILSLLSSALFSFADTPEDQRPGVSIFVDECQHFISSDFAELLTQARKYGCRLALANQYLGQLPPYLRQAVENAATKLCFRVIPEDARERAQYFMHGQTTLRPEDIEKYPVESLLHSDIADPNTEVFIEYYVRPNHRHKRGGRIVIDRPGARFDYFVADVLRIERPKTAVTVDDPLPLLNHLLYLAMQRRDPMLPIPFEVVAGFANRGKGYYRVFHSPFWLFQRRKLLEEPIAYPPYLVNGTGLDARWTRSAESEKEQLLHFLFHLRAACWYVAQYPLG